MKYFIALLMLFFIILLGFYLFKNVQEVKMKTPDNAQQQFDLFLKKEKFIENDKLFYPGIADPKLKPKFTEKINFAAKDFMEVAFGSDPTNKKYHAKIKDGLERFKETDFHIDTEDSERICAYFEELMDIVGLESSNGQLNNFRYGF